jgi:hypothetical protein
VKLFSGAADRTRRARHGASPLARGARCGSEQAISRILFLRRLTTAQAAIIYLGTTVTRRLKRPTRGFTGEQPASTPGGCALPLLGLAPDGVCPARRSPACRWALTPPFHPYPLKRAVWFLWHFPWGHPHWPLASIPLCGVRTFLEPLRRVARDCLAYSGPHAL